MIAFPNKGDGLSEQSVNRFRRKTAPCSKKENKVVVKRWNTKGDVLFFCGYGLLSGRIFGVLAVVFSCFGQRKKQI